MNFKLDLKQVRWRDSKSQEFVEGTYCGPVVEDLPSNLQGTWIQSLVGELSSHRLRVTKPVLCN